MIQREEEALRRPSLADLRESLRRLEEERASPRRDVISSGVEAIDRLLPRGGFRPGSIVEWIADAGSGATWLALMAAAQACREGGALLVIDERAEFYPLALPAGAIAGPLVVIRPASLRDAVWALDQSLRAGGVGAAVAWLDRLDDRIARRLQLAAEQGGALGLLLRPRSALSSPSWSEARFLVEAKPGVGARRLCARLGHCRRGPAGGTVELEIDDETGAVRLARELAPAASARGAARA